eukprot:1148136-Pyramimonas_sp.AAC.1
MILSATATPGGGECGSFGGKPRLVDGDVRMRRAPPPTVVKVPSTYGPGIGFAGRDVRVGDGDS